MPKKTETEAPSEALDIGGLVEQATADYRNAVDRHARGEPVDPNELRQILIVTGKGLAAFKADVDRLKSRYAAARDLKAAAELQGEITAATKVLAAAEAENTAETIRHREVGNKIDEKRTQAQAAFDSLAQRQAQLRTAAGQILSKTADATIAAETKRQQAEVQQATQDAMLRHHPEPRSAVVDKNASPKKQALAEREFAWAQRAHAVEQSALQRRDAAAEKMRAVARGPCCPWKEWPGKLETYRGPRPGKCLLGPWSRARALLREARNG